MANENMNEMVKAVAENETGVMAHLRRNWGWYLGGTALVAAGGVALYCYFNRDSDSGDAVTETAEAITNVATSSLEGATSALLNSFNS